MRNRRTPTKQELAEACARESRDAGLSREALNLHMHGKPDAIERAPWSPGSHYVFRLYGCGRAHGGVVIETFYCRGQRPHSAARYLDDYQPQLMVNDPRYAEAINRLRAARHRLTRPDPDPIPSREAYETSLASSAYSGRLSGDQVRKLWRSAP